MSFANDPAVLRLADALGVERKVARAVVRALVDVAPRAAPWIDGRDVAVTTGFAGDGGELLAALRRARLVTGEDGEIMLHELEGERLAVLIAEERAMAAAKKARNREPAAIGTLGGHEGDIEGTGGGPRVDEAGTGRGHEVPLSSDFGTETGTSRDGEGLAIPIPRVTPARGDSTSPLSPYSPAADSAPQPDSETFRLATSIRRRIAASINAPRGLDVDIAADLAAGRVTGPELLEAAVEARRKGGRSYDYLLAIIESRRRAQAEDESRAPPPVGRRGPSDPIPLEEFRLIREHEAEGPPGVFEW